MTEKVVQIRRVEEASIIGLLELAVERAKAGKIRCFTLVECGADVPQGQPKIRLSEGFDDIRDPVQMLALVGGMQKQIMTVMDSLDYDG